MIAYTDYPFEELGDTSGAQAPIRKCRVICWDGNKYAMIVVGDCLLRTSIKTGYLYRKPARVEYGQVIDIKKVPEVSLEEYVKLWE